MRSIHWKSRIHEANSNEVCVDCSWPLTKHGTHLSYALQKHTSKTGNLDIVQWNKSNVITFNTYHAELLISNSTSLHNWEHLLFICFFIDWEKQLSGVLDRFEFGFNLWKVEQEQIIWIRGRGRARHFFSNDFVKGTNNNFEYDLPCLNNYSIMRFVHFLFNMKHLLQYFDIINFYTYLFKRDKILAMLVNHDSPRYQIPKPRKFT